MKTSVRYSHTSYSKFIHTFIIINRDMKTSRADIKNKLEEAKHLTHQMLSSRNTNSFFASAFYFRCTTLSCFVFRTTFPSFYLPQQLAILYNLTFWLLPKIHTLKECFVSSPNPNSASLTRSPMLIIFIFVFLLLLLMLLLM